MFMVLMTVHRVVGFLLTNIIGPTIHDPNRWEIWRTREEDYTQQWVEQDQ